MAAKVDDIYPIIVFCHYDYFEESTVKGELGGRIAWKSDKSDKFILDNFSEFFFLNMYILHISLFSVPWDTQNIYKDVKLGWSESN